MPLHDQSGKRTTTLIREELGEHAVEPRAVDLLRHDDHAGLRHHFSIRAASVEMVLPVTDSSFVMRFTKGFFWFKEQPDEMGFLSVAGETLRIDFLNYWWAAMIENGRAQRENLPPALEKIWIEPFGDRRQELVFIGVDLDERAISEALDKCSD